MSSPEREIDDVLLRSVKFTKAILLVTKDIKVDSNSGFGLIFDEFLQKDISCLVEQLNPIVNRMEEIISKRDGDIETLANAYWKIINGCIDCYAKGLQDARTIVADTIGANLKMSYLEVEIESLTKVRGKYYKKS